MEMLNQILKGFIREILDVKGINELMINGPHRIYIEKNGVMTEYDDADLEITYDYLTEITNLIASHVSSVVDRDSPILSATLPSGERIEIVIPPACDKNQFVFSFRKPAAKHFTLDDYIEQDYFELINKSFHKEKLTEDNDKLKFYIKNRNWSDFFKLLVTSKKNVIVAGAVGSGKTHFINMLLSMIPMNERIITIENAREVLMKDTDKKRNMINLLSRANVKNITEIKNNDLLKSCLRLRPDRILLSEIRGDDAFDFLNSLHVGLSGSMTSIHANSTEDVSTRLVNMLSMSKFTSGFNKDDMLEYCGNSLDVILFCEKSNGKWRMTDVKTAF